MSGKRTKKSARKAAHAAKVAGKEQQALESAMQVGSAAVPLLVAFVACVYSRFLPWLCICAPAPEAPESVSGL